MNRKTKYGLDISEMQIMQDSISPIIQAAQMSSDMVASMNSSIINQQMLEVTQAIRESTKQLNQTFKSSGMARILESISMISEMTKSSTLIETNSALGNMIKSVSLQIKSGNNIQQLNLGFDPKIFETIQRLAIDTSAVEKNIQNNLRVFSEIDWTSVIEPEDLEEFDIENSLEGPVVDINDGISTQQRVVEFANKLKTKYPVVFMIFMIFVCNPLQSVIDDAVLDLISGTTKPIIEQTQTPGYRTIEKKIKVEVNNILNINIESREVKNNFIKNYRYVSTDKLIMRQRNRVKSKAVHTLEFGQVVKIVHKDRNWTLVEYESNEDVIRGWVFTRYISKFKK